MSNTPLRTRDGLIERLACMHSEMLQEPELGIINRIAIALYDAETGHIRGLLHSADDDNDLDLSGISVPLSGSESLSQLAKTGGRRIINDLTLLAGKNSKAYMQAIFRAGYRSSYTVPMLDKGKFYGFLFFNSTKLNAFTKSVVSHIKPRADMIALAVMRDLDAANMILSTIRVMQTVSLARDGETGCHLDRMANYSRMIALTLGAEYGASTEFSEFVHIFAPMHDVGKIAIPDSILLKPGRLTEDEYDVMKTHVVRGVEIVDAMQKAFGASALPNFQVMRNTVAYHHESLDGKGYPYGRKGDEIPLEARIVAVADVFDALTSVRPYKKAWTNQEAFAFLQDNAGERFDAGCVAALHTCADDVIKIQERYADLDV